MNRQEFSRKVKAAAFLRADGWCELCPTKLAPGKFQYHHIKEANDGGEPTLANCLVVCTACHVPLTAVYVKETRKAERQRDRHIGAFPKSKRPMPGSRASGLRKRMDGTVERRS